MEEAVAGSSASRVRADHLRASTVRIRAGGATILDSPRGSDAGTGVAVRDHSSVEVLFWKFDRHKLSQQTVDVSNLQRTLTRSQGDSVSELERDRRKLRKLSSDELKVRARQGARGPHSATCRWFHLPGCNHAAVDLFHQAYNWSDTVAMECKEVTSKPACSWHQGADSTYDHLFIVGHYILADAEPDSDGIKVICPVHPYQLSIVQLVTVPCLCNVSQGFTYEQVHIIYTPDLNTLISIDGNGEKEWNNVVELLPNERGFVRTGGDAALLVYKIVDSMIDEVYPLLDLYGGALGTP